ncbi:MAG: hypothetical protein IT483_15680 [Gammaproteobacteria bacterium]|nr:hypothetical protein [Gammaproteobacteria bacterium]
MSAARLPTQEEANAAAIAAIAQDMKEGRIIVRPTPGDYLDKLAQPADWRSALRKRGDRIIGDENNIITAIRLAPELRGIVRFNEFSGQVEVGKPLPWRPVTVGEQWLDSDDVQVAAWLQERSVDARPLVTGPAVEVVARDNVVHPVRDYLKSLQWDHEARLHLWLVKYLDARGPSDYLAAVGSCWLKSGVARALYPGCKADCTEVLEGAQGIGKSQVAAILAVQPEWFSDSLPDLHSKDASIQLAGRWIVELSELAAARRSESEAIKAFLSRTHENYRPPYGKRTVQLPRQCVFIGTTNSDAYLTDATGNRRFWPVRCGKIDLDALRRDRDQLWAEAYARVVAGEAWHLSAADTALATREQATREVVTELETAVRDLLDRLESQGIEETTMRRVLTEALNLNADASDYAERAGRLGPQAAAAMRRHGWVRVGSVGHGENRRNVYRRQTSQGVTR